MARFTYDEELKIGEIAISHLNRQDSNVETGCSHSIVWRRGNDFVVVVWCARDVSEDEYVQYNYHVTMRVIYKEHQRFLRVVGAHKGGLNAWTGPFKCGSCELKLERL